MTKSKSKTFPKGTDFQELADFFTAQVKTTDFDLGSLDREDDCTTKEKYIITVTEVVQEVKEGEKL